MTSAEGSKNNHYNITAPLHFTSWMNTFEGSKHRLHLPRVSSYGAGKRYLYLYVKVTKSKHSEVGPQPTSLAGWTHLKAASNRLHLPRGLLATEPVKVKVITFTFT